jgi:hypothetical protein
MIFREVWFIFVSDFADAWLMSPSLSNMYTLIPYTNLDIDISLDSLYTSSI